MCEQMMDAGNSNNWWSMNSMLPPSQQQPSSTFLPSLTSLFQAPLAAGSSSATLDSLAENYQDLPQSWSQLLLGELAGGEDKKSANWENQILNSSSQRIANVDHVKKEPSQSHDNYPLYREEDGEFHVSRPAWSQLMTPVSSPRSCVTSLCSSGILDFSYNKPDVRNPDHSSECNSIPTSGVIKKARIQPSSTQPPLKVRKEKLGDRITALHQLVSPFGKTDTASVLFEAIGYIKFLQGQIEALSFPYLGNGASGNTENQQSVQGERNCKFPEDPGQLLNDTRLKREAPNQGTKTAAKDLRSRGLCLVPVSSTHHVESENGADYWSPAIGGWF